MESTDGKPADVKDIRFTLSNGATVFNPVTGLAATNTSFINIITPATAVGAITKLRATFFITAEEESLDIKAEVLDASGNILNTITAANVPFKRNRATFLTGECYSASESASFQAETTFLSDLKLTF